MPRPRHILVLALALALATPSVAEAGRPRDSKRLFKAAVGSHSRADRGNRRKASRVRRWSRRQVRKLKRQRPRKGRAKVEVIKVKAVKVKAVKVAGKGKIRARVKTALGAMSRKLHIPQPKKSIDRKLCVARGYCTLAADRIEGALPKPLARGYSKLRLASPGHLAAFTGHKFAKDPLFLSSFGVAYPIAAHMQVPVYIALGMNPVAAVAVHEAVEIPLGLGILAWRQHALRKDKSQTFGGTLKALGREHADFARDRQQESRRFMKQRAQKKQQGSLGHIGMALAAQ